MLQVLVYLISLLLVSVILHTVVRIIRYFYKFPMPQFLANLIDNPFRRRIQPPNEMPIRHGITPGMTVLEVGPGNGRYTISRSRNDQEKPENRAAGPHGTLTPVFGYPFNFREVLIIWEYQRRGRRWEN